MNQGAAGTARVERVEEMFRRADQAIEQRDREAGIHQAAEFWHEDCEWIPLITAVEGESTYRGREGILDFYEDFIGSFEVRYRDVDHREIGDAVVFLANMELRGRESGVEVESELGVVYEFDGELIRRGKAYDSHTAALAAAEEFGRA